MGVEEQFYLVFPVIAILSVRLCRRGLWLIIPILAGLSLLLSIWLTTKSPNANFYLLPTRAWELLAGVLVAITPLPVLDRRWPREVFAAAGASAIAYAVFRFSPFTPFPGLHAIAPCGGAAAIIACGSRGQTMTGRALSLAPIRFIGLISYSLYLWHWPVIVLLMQGLPTASLPPMMQLTAGLVSLLLAIASWRIVETPFRHSKADPKRVFAVSAATMAVMGLVCASLILARGVPSRFPPAAVRMASYLDYPHDAMFRAGHCFLTSSSTGQRWPGDCLSMADGRPNVLVAGDSHSAHLYPGLVADHISFRRARPAAAPSRIHQPIPMLAVLVSCAGSMPTFFGKTGPISSFSPECGHPATSCRSILR